ncbi:MAG: YegP family protein [bacterium]|nr:YegP family protein [bacterium]
MKIIYYKSTKNGDWRFQAKARNGKILFSGEGYERRATMLRILTKYFPDVVPVKK